MDLSRAWKVTACCIALAMLVMPLHAQNKEAENVKKKNEVLLKQIQAIAKDTTELKNRISENRKQLQQKQDTLQALRTRNEDLENALQTDALQAKVDSLERNNNTLKERYETLCKEEKSKSEELDGLNIDVKEMNIYSDIERRQLFEQNQALFSRRYSELNRQQVDDLVKNLTDFKNMEGYADYEKKMKFMQQNKTLYDECMAALNNKFDADKVQELRDRMLPLRQNIENKANGIYKLSPAQFNELDSIDIRLSRFNGGLRELQAIINKVNNDADILRMRAERKDRTAIGAAIAKYVDKEVNTRKKDWKNQNLVERYFNMVPYLEKAFKAYKKELSDEPFNTTGIEKEILTNETE